MNTTKTTISRLWTAAAAALALCAGTAFAGDPVRLLVELPPDVRNVEAGQQVDVQVVPEDSGGQRVRYKDGTTVEVSSTEGRFELVQAPYKYRYTPPSTVEGPVSVRLRAWVRQEPDVKGETSLQVVPPRPYVRLVLRAPATTAALGSTTEIELLGEKADGTVARVKDQAVTVRVASGPGTVELVQQGWYRYVAPGRDETGRRGQTARIVAQLERYPQVAGELSILIADEAPPGGGSGTPGTGGGTQPGSGGSGGGTQPGSGGTPGGGSGTPGAGGTTPPADDEDAGGVLWPSGNVRLVVWRSKPAKADPWAKKKNELPGAGKALVTRDTFHRLRVIVERQDVRKIELEYYVGEKKGAPIKTDTSNPDGKLRMEKNKAGRTVALIETEAPEAGKPLVLNLLLTTADGKVLREEFVVQRGRDRDDDGQKDRR